MSNEADEVRELLDDFAKQDLDEYTSDVTKSVEGLMAKVVQEGSFFPDGNLKAELRLTLSERITGKREQDVTAPFLMGLMLGTALERDIPEGTELEEEWRNGNFVLPETEYEE